MRDHAILTRDDTLGGAELIVTQLVNARFSPHAHDALMLGLIEYGTKRFRRDGRDHVASTGSISVVNPGEWHTGAREAGDYLRYNALYLPAQTLESTTLQICRPTLEDPQLYRALLECAFALREQAPRLERDEKAQFALGLMYRRYGDVLQRPLANAGSRTIGRIRDLLHAEFATSMPIRTLAEQVGLSPTHLMREFRRATGVTLHAYQANLRVQEARRLLALGVAPAAVAIDVGYSDQPHLTRRFRALTGLTPAAYQRATAR